MIGVINMSDLFCESCGAILAMGPGFAVCSGCGKKYGIAKINELYEKAEAKAAAEAKAKAEAEAALNANAEQDSSENDVAIDVSNVTPIRANLGENTTSPKDTGYNFTNNVTPIRPATVPEPVSTQESEVFIDTIEGQGADTPAPAVQSTPIATPVNTPIATPVATAPENSDAASGETPAPQEEKPSFDASALTMKCDDCGSELIMAPGYARCSGCGRKYGPASIKAKQDEIEEKKKSMGVTAGDATSAPAATPGSETSPSKKQEEKAETPQPTRPEIPRLFITCDDCGGELELKTDYARCKGCGKKYGPAKIREKQDELEEKKKVLEANAAISSNPTPVVPTPIKPLVTPPINATPVSPAPVAATPVSATPVASTPVAPTPVKPAPVSETKADTPVAQATPTEPAKVAPTPVKPTPVAATPVSTPKAEAPKPETPVAKPAPTPETPKPSGPVSYSFKTAKPIKANTDKNESVNTDLPELKCDFCGEPIKISSNISQCTGCGKKFFRDKIDEMLAAAGYGDAKKEEAPEPVKEDPEAPLKCDICGEKLELKHDSAKCPSCGKEYGQSKIDEIKEKFGEDAVPKPDNIKIDKNGNKIELKVSAVTAGMHDISKFNKQEEERKAEEEKARKAEEEAKKAEEEKKKAEEAKKNDQVVPDTPAEEKKEETPKEEPPKNTIQLRAVPVTGGRSRFSQNDDMDAFMPNGEGVRAEPRRSAMQRMSVSEGNDDIPSTNSKEVNEKLEQIDAAFGIKDYIKANRICDELIKIDENCPEAYINKAKAMGYMQDRKDNLEKASEFILKGISVARDNKKARITTRGKEIIDEVSNETIKRKATEFESDPSDVTMHALFDSITYVIDLTGKTFTQDEAAVALIKERMARWLPIYAVRAQAQAQTKYRKVSNIDNEQKSLFDFSSVTDYCVWLVEKAIELDGKENPKNIEYYDTLIRFHQTIINTYDASMKKYQDPNIYGSKTAFDKVKEIRNERIENCKQEKKELNKLTVLNMVNEKDERMKKNEAQREARVDGYWSAHPDEKEKLEKERDRLQSEVNKLQNLKKNPPNKVRLEEYESELRALKAERDALGIFQSNKKKSIQEQIDKKEALKIEMAADLRATEENLQSEIDSNLQRLGEIERELNRNR